MGWGFRGRLGPPSLIVACLVLTLSACSGDNDGVGTVTPGVTASAVPTPIVSATPPALPSGKPTPASAVEFVHYFWDAYNYAYQTYDTGPLRSVSKTSCISCSALIQDAKSMGSSGTKISGYELRVIEATSPAAEITTGTLVESVLSQEPGKALSPDGNISELTGFKSVRSTVSLEWNGHDWLVEAVTNDPKSRRAWPE